MSPSGQRTAPCREGAPMSPATDLRAYLATLEQLPAGTLAPVAGLVAEIRQRLPEADAPVADVTLPAAVVPLTWRERLWLVPPETRLGVVELGEALGRPKSWVYRHTGAACEQDPLPCRKLDGELVFVAGEIRVWLAEHETVITEPPQRATPITSIARPRPSARRAS